MKSKTKLTVCIAAMLLLTALVIISVIAVFSAEQQNFVSNVSVKYISKEVIGSASAKYAVGGFSGATAKPMTTENGATEITFAPTQTASSTLSPRENLEIAEPGQFVMLEYDFTNETAHPVGVTLTYEDVDADDENIKISTATTPMTDFFVITGGIDSLIESGEDAAAACVDKFSNTLSSTILPNSKITIWVLVQVDNIGRDSIFSGNFTFNLDGTVEDYTETFTYATNGEYATITGVAQGTMVDLGELMGEENMGIPFVLLEGPELNIKAGYKYKGLPVKTVGTFAFAAQMNISSITSFGDVKTLGYCSFGMSGLTGTLTIPGTVKNIIGAFVGTAISGLNLQNGLENIGFSAFNSCEELTEVTIPESVKTIGCSAFDGSGIENITIGSGVTTIGGDAFYDCVGLTEVIIPANVKIIEHSAFAYCLGLQNLTLGTGITTIETDTFTACKKLTEVIIPENVKTIGYGAFSGCTSLETLTIGSGVTTIGDSAFQDCDLLTEVIIPESVTTIGDWAFYGCTSLETLTIIGSGITSIGDIAFVGCSSLNEVIIGSKTIYKNTTSSSSNGRLTYYLKSSTGKVKVLASIDDGSNEYLKTNFTKDSATETIGGKQYNIYTKK